MNSHNVDCFFCTLGRNEMKFGQMLKQLVFPTCF